MRSPWILIAIGVVLILVAMVARPDDARWMTVLGLAIGALLVIVGLRRRRAVTRQSP